MSAKVPEREWQDRQVTEAGIESFPASDPPSYNMPGRGDKKSHDGEPQAGNEAEAGTAQQGSGR